MPHRSRSSATHSLFLLAFLLSFTTDEAAADTIRGRVDRFDRGPCPHGFCEWLSFDMSLTDGTRVNVLMRERVIEGTVFVGHTVMVEGSWRNTGSNFKGDRVTDLVTSATFGDGDRSASLRYPDGRRMTVTGVIDNLQPVEQPTPGMRNKMQRRRFVLLVATSSPSGEDVKISVERVAPQVTDLLAQGDEVIVEGRWTKRNVLRADSITRK